MKPAFRHVITALLLAPTYCGAAELIFPSNATSALSRAALHDPEPTGSAATACSSCGSKLNVIERDGPIEIVYRTGLQATGSGTLKVDWTDVYGRQVESFALPVQLTDETEFRFSLDGRRAVAMQNEVAVHFSFDGKNKKMEPDHREEDVRASFVASPPDRKWWDYLIMMWQENTVENFGKLKTVGINGGEYNAHRKALPEFLLKNDLRWYVENIATDFYSAYHIYRPDRPYNAALLETKAIYQRDVNSKEAFKRHPSLSDAEWLAKIKDRVSDLVTAYKPYRPIFYNLADEAGIAELAGFWDFDFSEHSLDPMRRWLKDSYGSLEALNRQWNTSFTNWDSVTPDTTREAMARKDENYSAWADHKTWMDKSFADALKAGVDAAQAVDPDAYVAIEGGQMPGWGGYDYSRLSNVLSAMEPYDIGSNIEIIRSLNPEIPLVTTAFARGPWEKQRLWFELLHGARGHIIWDEKFEVVERDGKVGSRGQELEPYYSELRNGTGALLINSVRQTDAVAIHYSQPSLRTNWMLAQRPKGDAWVERMSWTERKDSDFLGLRDSYCRLVEDQGLQYNFVSYGQVETGELAKRGYKILILPGSNSLSRVEAQQIVAFVQQGGTLIVDGEAGTFDEHSRRLPESSLASILGGQTGLGKVVHLNALEYHHQRVLGTELPMLTRMHEIVKGASVKPLFAVVDMKGNPVTGIETHTFSNGGATIVGLLSNPQIDIDELGPPEFKSNKRFEKPQTVRLQLPTELYAYDIRQSKALGRLREITLTVNAYEPTLLSFSPVPFPPLEVKAPAEAELGTSINLGLTAAGHSTAQTHIFHVDVQDGAGKGIPQYSGNVQAPQGQALRVLPIAKNDSPGRWKIVVKDVLSGQQQTSWIQIK